MAAKLLPCFALAMIFFSANAQSRKTQTGPTVGTQVELSPQSATPQNVRLSQTMYLGQPSLQVTDVASPDLGDAGRLVLLPCSFLQDGTIKIDVAGNTVPNAAPTARGFVGMAFRVSSDRSAPESSSILSVGTRNHA